VNGKLLEFKVIVGHLLHQLMPYKLVVKI